MRKKNKRDIPIIMDHTSLFHWTIFQPSNDFKGSRLNDAKIILIRQINPIICGIIPIELEKFIRYTGINKPARTILANGPATAI